MDIKRYLVIVAGGKGERMGTDIPKQFLSVCSKPVIMHTVQKFMDFDPAIEKILVIHPDWAVYWKSVSEEYNFKTFDHIVEGGVERFHSVKNGLSLVIPDSIVAIHDAVRPLVTVDTISRCFTVAEKEGNAIPFISPPESVRIEKRGSENISVERNSIKLIQTPQVFRSDLIIDAYKQEYQQVFTDDATVLESAGYRIILVEGNRENIKITTPGDLAYAQSILSTG